MTSNRTLAAGVPAASIAADGRGGGGASASAFSRRWAAIVALVSVTLLPAIANAIGNVYVFGDSLSDTGNNALLLGTDPGQVITDNTYIPTHPYASGRYSNGEVWTVGFAASLGLGGSASLAGGNLYAYGSARSRTDGPQGQPSVRAQVSAYLQAHRGVADPDALYIIECGGNNARDTLDAIAGGAPLLRTLTTASRQYAADVKLMAEQLGKAGARSIVVWNTPDLSLSPAVRAEGPSAVALARTVVRSMNDALTGALAGQTGVSVFDAFSLFDEVAAHPAEHGLLNVTDACGAVAGCDPSTYLFWDGIHPTSAGHGIIGSAMTAAVQ